ncbi:MAG: QcrA and Rieske domain-containing protein [bacterium]
MKNGRVTRRRFVNYLLGGGLIATAISALYPIINFIIPPKVKEAEVVSAVAGKVGELSPNSAKIFRFGSRPGILIRAADGTYRALSAVCTHLSCIVQYRPDLQHIWCACHNGHFDLNGRVLSGPPPKPLEEFAVNIQGENIIVSRAG